MLASGSLGVSTLVCLINNGNNGATETTANLLGPFWRLEFAPHRKRRLDRALADAGPGAVLQHSVNDRDGKPVADAEVDVWQSSTEGFTRTRTLPRPT